MLSVCVGVGGCLFYIHMSAWRAGMASLQFMYRSISSNYAAEDMTVFIICATVRMDPLFGGLGESLDMKKWPPVLILEFV